MESNKEPLSKIESFNCLLAVAFALYFLNKNLDHGITGTKEVSAVGYGAWPLFIALILGQILKKIIWAKSENLYSKWEKNHWFEILEVSINILLFPIAVLFHRLMELKGYDIRLIGHSILGIMLSTYCIYAFILYRKDKNKGKETN